MADSNKTISFFTFQITRFFDYMPDFQSIDFVAKNFDPRIDTNGHEWFTTEKIVILKYDLFFFYASTRIEDLDQMNAMDLTR